MYLPNAMYTYSIWTGVKWRMVQGSSTEKGLLKSTLTDRARSCASTGQPGECVLVRVLCPHSFTFNSMHAGASIPVSPHRGYIVLPSISLTRVAASFTNETDHLRKGVWSN